MWTRTALIQFVGGLAAYIALLLATTSAFDRGVVPMGARIPVALLPMLPLLLVTLGVMTAIRNSDELNVRMQFEALAFAFALTALTTFSYGFLETFAGLPRLSYFFVWPVMAVFWIVGRLVAARRYA